MLLSRRQYAKHRGVGSSTVQSAINAGRITLVDGKIDPDKADKEWEENTNPAYHTGRNPELMAIRTRKTTYDALLKKLDYEIETGKLWPIEWVSDQSFKAARRTRDKILAIPRRMAHVLANKSEEEIGKVLHAELEECLDGFADWLNNPPSPKEVKLWIAKK